jgi:hypothetical protein
LVEVVVFCKMGPATPEVHLAISIVPHLYLVGSSPPPECSRRTASQSSRPSMNLVNFSNTH